MHLAKYPLPPDTMPEISCFLLRLSLASPYAGSQFIMTGLWLCNRKKKKEKKKKEKRKKKKEKEKKEKKKKEKSN